MHSWGDEWFQQYGEDLRDAEIWISKFFYRVTKGNMSISMKEKWGSLRYEYIMTPRSDWYRENPFTEELGMYNALQLFGWELLTIIIYRAVKKWPHLEHELMEDLACHENLVGDEIANKYWKRL